jgi:hypothetical protein
MFRNPILCFLEETDMLRRTLAFAAAGVLGLVFTNLMRAEEDKGEARALVAKAIKAAGGEEKLAKNKAFKFKETGTYYGMGEGLPYNGVYAEQLPDKFRMEIVGVFTMVLDGDKGWTNMGGNTQEMTKEQMAEHKEGRYFRVVTTLLPLKEKSYTLTLLPEAKVGDKPAAGVKVAHKDHRDVSLYFDRESGLLIKAQTQVKFEEQGGKDADQEVLYSDYKEVNGIQVPHKIVVKRDGKNYVEAQVTEFQALPKLDNSVFAKP